MGKWCEMATVDVKYDTTPHDGTPGPPWDDFEERILGVAAGRTDERGWSLADCANQTDEGGVGGPAIPVGGAANAKALTARRKRLKELYALLYKHELDTDHRTHVYQNHFQDGDGAFQYLIATMRTPIDRLQLRELDDKWAKVDILQDVGVQENTILLIATKIKAHNAKRPVANRKDQTECTERLLECIFTTSKHFSETALNEYNAVGAARRFVIAAGPLAGQRDFNACATHFHALWKAAVKSKMPGFHVRTRSRRPSTASSSSSFSASSCGRRT